MGQMRFDYMTVEILCDLRDFRAKSVGVQKCVLKNRPEGGAKCDRCMLMT